MTVNQLIQTLLPMPANATVAIQDDDMLMEFDGGCITLSSDSKRVVIDVTASSTEILEGQSQKS
jgi:hypothetical protein